MRNKKMPQKLLCFIMLSLSSTFWPLEIYAKSMLANKNLERAVILSDVNGVEQALKAGANPNGSDRTGRSPVVIALITMPTLKFEDFHDDEVKEWMREEEKKCIEILKRLLDTGARAEQSHLRWPIERNSVLVLKLLLQRGTDVKTPIGSFTPIELAVKYDSPDVAAYLIEKGAEPVGPYVAAQLRLLDGAENHDIIRMDRALKQGAKLERDFKGIRVSALLIAANSYASGLKHENQSYAAIAYLLQKGANPNFKGAGGNTSLHSLAFATVVGSGNTPDMLAAKKTYRRLSLQALMKGGADVSSQNDKGKTPLHVAVMWDNVLGVEILLENGANAKLRDKDGKTPVDYAESAEMTKLLKAHGAEDK